MMDWHPLQAVMEYIDLEAAGVHRRDATLPDPMLLGREIKQTCSRTDFRLLLACGPSRAVAEMETEQPGVR